MKGSLRCASRRTINCATLLVATVLIGACATSTKEELPAVTEDGLVLVEGTRADAVYKLPDADFSQYERVYIADVEVAFRKNWLEDQNRERRSVSHRITQEDADKIRQAVAGEFSKVFTEELEKGGYPVVSSPGEAGPTDDVLALVPAIVNLDIAAPDTMSAGRTRSYTASAGSMTLYMEFRDAVTGALLGRVTDAQAAPDTGYMRVSNSVTNMAEADRMLRKWARKLVERMDDVHGR